LFSSPVAKPRPTRLEARQTTAGEILRYEVSAHSGPPLPWPLSNAERARYLQLPPVNIRIYSLARAWSGDGAPLEESVLRLLEELYRTEAASFAWESGDVLMLDNMSVAHARAPYTGPRKIIVALGDPIELFH